jgi:DNA-binding Lrp family transcriptional regulator
MDLKEMLDEVDRRVLEELLRDSKQSLREIAAKARVSVGTVLARVKRMEKAGVIKDYTVILDYEKLGYELTAVTEITASKGKLLEVDREIAKMPMTCAVYDITGLTDAIVIAKFKNREELSNFTKTLLTIPHVERTNTHIVLTTIKEDLRLL